MPSRRPPHSKAHAVCPYGVFNWGDCDFKASHRFGQCTVMVGDREPEQCSRFAFDERGWCGQHYASSVERIKKAERIAIAKASLDQRINQYIAWRSTHPSIWE
jgi:hypothetical protein